MTCAGAAVNARDGLVTAACAGGAGHVTADWMDARCGDVVDAVGDPQLAIRTTANVAPIASMRCRTIVVTLLSLGIGDPVYAVAATGRYRWYARRHWLRVDLTLRTHSVRIRRRGVSTLRRRPTMGPLRNRDQVTHRRWWYAGAGLCAPIALALSQTLSVGATAGVASAFTPIT